MKKVIVMILIIVSGSFAKAQSFFSIGPKVGYNSYELSTNKDSVQASIKNSFQIGAFMRIGSRFYIQPEANYMVNKSTLSQKAGTGVTSQEVTISTLKVPAILGIKLINRKAFNFRVLAGPAVTFVLDKQLNPEHMGEFWPIQSVNDFKDNIWSIQMGAGMDIFFMTLDVRYEMGIENIYNGGSDLEMKHNLFNVSLGIKLL